MVLNRLFHTSLRVGKQVRSETGIGDSSLSVPHVAVKLAEGVFGTLRGRRALVLGAGDMSELLIKHLMSRSVEEVRIANRTPSAPAGSPSGSAAARSPSMRSRTSWLAWTWS